MARVLASRGQRQSGSSPTRRGPRLQFFRETIAELKKVVWPTREQATRLTVLVIIISLVVGVLLGAMDLAFGGMFRLMI